MLFDLLTSLTTPCSPHLRALGYLDETLDMRIRARLNRAAWRSHLENSNRFVLTSAEKCGKRNRVVVLGSGLLLDVPLDGLSSLFREVVLKDVVCLPEVRKQIKRYGNVAFVEHDVTGLAGQLYRNHTQRIHELPAILPSRAGEDEADLIVSLNILSQLWVVPRAFAGRRLPNIDPVKIDEWCARITEGHYAALRTPSCDVCLVADHEFVKRDGNGKIISKGSTVYGLPLPPPDEEWTWNIAPLGKTNPHTSKELIVGAWHFRKE